MLEGIIEPQPDGKKINRITCIRVLSPDAIQKEVQPKPVSFEPGFGTKEQVEEIESTGRVKQQAEKPIVSTTEVPPVKQALKGDIEALNRLEKDRIEARVKMLEADARRKQWDRVKEQPLISRAKFASDPVLAVLAEEVLISESELRKATEEGNDVKIQSTQGSLEKSEKKLQAALDAVERKIQAEYVVAKAKYEALDQERQRLETGKTACAWQQAESYTASFPDEKLSEQKIRNLAQTYIKAMEHKDFEAWKELLSPMHPGHPDLNTENFTSHTHRVSSIQIENIEGQNVRLSIQRDTGRKATGYLIIHASGHIKYTPFVFKHPVRTAAQALAPLVSDNYSFRNTSVHVLKEAKVPLFGYDLDAPGDQQKEEARKILNWLRENGATHDTTEPKVKMSDEELQECIGIAQYNLEHYPYSH
jgi:hypothetical protein